MQKKDGVDRRGFLSLAAAITAFLAATEASFGETGRDRVEVFLAALLEPTDSGNQFRELLVHSGQQATQAEAFAKVEEALSLVGLWGLLSTSERLATQRAVVALAVHWIDGSPSGWERLNNLNNALRFDEPSSQFGC